VPCRKKSVAVPKILPCRAERSCSVNGALANFLYSPSGFWWPCRKYSRFSQNSKGHQNK
jgi:hypothetical protein